jgi:hypothetical protein
MISQGSWPGRGAGCPPGPENRVVRLPAQLADLARAIAAA